MAKETCRELGNYTEPHEVKFSVSSAKTNNHPRVAKGLQIGNDIYISEGIGILVLLTYCHEVGHFIAGKLSFRGRQVLTPDETKEKMLKGYLDYRANARNLFNTMVFEGTELMPSYKAVIPIANDLLKIYTMGWFDERMINFHPVSFQDIEHLLRKALEDGRKCSSVIKVDHEGKYVSANSKEGRNTELPALTVEYGCLHILANSIEPYQPLFLNELQWESTNRSGRRAQLIVTRAYQGRNWVLPSTRDLELHTTELHTGCGIR